MIVLSCFWFSSWIFGISWTKAHSRNFKVGSELNWTQRMHLGSPYKKGEEEYSKCEMYKVLLLVNYNHNAMSLIDCEWKENVAKSRSDFTDVREEYTCLSSLLMIMIRRRIWMRARTQVENWTHVLVENGNEWPKDPDPTWNVTQCLHGWNYDRYLELKSWHGTLI